MRIIALLRVRYRVRRGAALLDRQFPGERWHRRFATDLGWADLNDGDRCPLGRFFAAASTEGEKGYAIGLRAFGMRPDVGYLCGFDSDVVGGEQRQEALEDLAHFWNQEIRRRWRREMDAGLGFR